MNMQQVNEVEVECSRVIKRIEELRERIRVEDADFKKRKAARPDDKYVYHFDPFTGCAETGALKRASMDLSRALVKLR